MSNIVGNELKFIRLNDNDLIGRCMDKGFFEGHIIEVAAKLLQNKPAGVILDIGANMGSFTVPLAYYNPTLQFVCFEPQRQVYYQLCGNIALNGLRNVTAHNFGLDTTDRFIDIEVPDYTTENNIGAFSLDAEVREHDDYLCKSKGGVERMQLLQLDGMGLTNISLIKLDVEGMELNVLKGGLKTLEVNNYPPIVFESWKHKDWFLPRRQELITFLESNGYVITPMGEDNIAIHGEQ